MINPVSGAGVQQLNAPAHAAPTNSVARMSDLVMQGATAQTSTLQALQRSAEQSQTPVTSSSSSTNSVGSATPENKPFRLEDMFSQVADFLKQASQLLMQVMQAVGQGVSGLTSMISSFASSAMGGISSIASPMKSILK
ncbi:hypothetical protein [Burkholderia pyrrocinia]